MKRLERKSKKQIENYTFQKFSEMDRMKLISETIFSVFSILFLAEKTRSEF